MYILGQTKTKVPLVTFVAAVRANQQYMIEKGLHQPFSPRPMERRTATVWATQGMRSIEYELHKAPFQAQQRSGHRRREGAGDQPSGGQPDVGTSILLARHARFQ